MKRLSLALLLPCLFLPLPAAAGKQVFDDSASVVLLEIPVTVTHGGKAVRGLERESFMVETGGEKHHIVDFKDPLGRSLCPSHSE